MDIQIGKMYEVTHPTIVETIVFSSAFEEVARFEQGETFVVLEFLGIHHWTTPSNEDNNEDSDQLLKMKVLTASGKIGCCSFWASEIKIVQN